MCVGVDNRIIKVRGMPTLEHTYQAAQQVLTEQVDIVMPPTEWAAFCKALDAPPRPIPALQILLTEASVFDEKGVP
jgi:uncharacterized protein (DUF1778 family)